tara:strand:- start:9541 stop:9762 length:222 start_codon:yes stop_codon:yes gene_type:complete
MQYRIKMKDLEGVMDMLSRYTNQTYTLDIAYGGYRLANEDGSYLLSHRVSKKELYEQIHLAIEVISHAQEQGE